MGNWSATSIQITTNLLFWLPVYGRFLTPIILTVPIHDSYTGLDQGIYYGGYLDFSSLRL